MSHFTRLFCSTALVTALLPQFANADVTADDVWQNLQDYIATLGGDFTNSVDRQGDTLLVKSGKLAYQMPLGLGNFALTLPDFSMTENGDGTVAITYANPGTYGMSVDITDKGSFSGNLDFTTLGYETTASGMPGDVTYTYSVERMDFQVSDIELDIRNPTDETKAPPEIAITGSFHDMSGVARVTVAEMVTMESTYSYGLQDMTFDMEFAQGLFAYAVGADSASGTAQLTLPRNGMDIMNLAAALRDGLTFSVSSKTTGYRTSQTAEENGVAVSDQSTSVQEQSAQYSLDQTGLQASGTALDARMDAQPGKDIPFALKLAVEKAEASMVLPLAASSELQDVAYDILLQGLTLDEEIWSLFDPAQTLPRDPMTVEMDMSVKVSNKLNWLDFMAVKSELDGDEVPIELHEATLKKLIVDMVGARLSVTGSGSFDNSDLESFGGFPRPAGVIDLKLMGGNGLLDRLVAMGLLTEEDATGARLGAAVFTKPDPDAGEDALQSRLEMNEEGHILANGQRLR